MRLSDLMEKGGDTLDKPEKVASPRPTPESPPPEHPPASDERKSPQPPPVQWLPRAASTVATDSDSVGRVGNRTYDSVPRAIYEAAQQLEIAIPQNKELTLQRATSIIKEFFTAVSAGDDVHGEWGKIRNISSDIAALIAADTNFARAVVRQNDDEDHLVRHCVNSALIAVDLGMNVKKKEHTDHEIVSAALLHDIGLAALGIDFKYTESASRFEAHVAEGVEILRTMNVPEPIVTMVAQHHESIDGTGYPNKISRPDYLAASQIISLAESFERIMSETIDAADSNIGNYVQATIAKHRKNFDPDILKAFISLQGFYPDGTMVELTNRSICMVIRQNAGAPLRPVVKVVIDGAGNHPAELEIKDLQSARSLSIIRAITNTEAIGKA